MYKRLKNFPYFIFFAFLPLNAVAESANGTGFLVSSDGYVVTNNHVIKDATKISIITSYGASHLATVVKKDVNNDLVLLKIDGKNYPFIEVSSSSNIQRGEKIYTLGFPQISIQGSEPKLTDGVISSLSGLMDEPTTFQITNPIQPGNSGGPLFTEDGEVIGVIVSTLDAIVMAKQTGNIPQNVNFAIKSNYLIELLRSINPSKYTQQKKAKGFFSQSSKLVDTVKKIEKSVVIVSVELKPEILTSASGASSPPKQSSKTKPPNIKSANDKNKTLATLEDCKSLLPDMRKKYPEKLDDITVLTDAECMSHKGRTILIYQYNVDIISSDDVKETMISTEPEQRKQLCSNKKVRGLLDYVDVLYYYVDKNGDELHLTLHKKSQCN